MHVGLGDLDVIEPGRRVHDDRPSLGALADHLLVDLGLGRHVDDDVGLDLGLAAEAAAGREAAFGVVALLDGVPRGERVLGDGEPMLRERAVGRGHLALRADAAAAADRVEVDAERAGGGEDGGAGGDAAALARGSEDDERVGHGCAAAGVARVQIRSSHGKKTTSQGVYHLSINLNVERIDDGHVCRGEVPHVSRREGRPVHVDRSRDLDIGPLVSDRCRQSTRSWRSR